ncbi:SRPBCC domain-containing protein [Candidatus Paraluminiphilus aquimaris]|jgi:uncharacterized protein YndB with AHSA1/START domain|uniref:SRPBCC domain-containing protein n=1 Tax=Candidatus Paraluminiphilus aquimaris TaxID=2518994 RepID=A0ABY6Q8N2_9GAMM|nr:SRPBCC domain-containing protein [Candidatus Paraluminiphilus aquimaris]UZP74566.1 SRPBCC domain-containing protein [Candidatus Paraluminiphilus aquimaris]
MKIEFLREIAAPKEIVWQVITDFSSYGEWNPFVTACDAELRVGAPISMTVALGSNTRDQVEFVSRVVEGELFEYRMKPVGLLLHSYRQHEIAASGDGKTMYRSTFELRGWLSGLVSMSLGSALRDGFHGMTDSLVSRAESLVEPSVRA